jgi:hypothetical protein
MCMAIRTRSVLSHPPSVKPQRPLTLKSNNPYKCIPNIHLQHIKNTHRHSFNTEILAGKTASVCINKNASLQRCSEHEIQQSLISFSTLSAYYFCAFSATFLPTPLYKRDSKIFYMRGLFELFPPIYLPYSITLNGLSSPESDLDFSLTNIQGSLQLCLCKA